MKPEEFQARLSERYDGYWELLATAVGVAASVERTVRDLRGDVLAEGPGPRTPTLSVTELRIESLAVSHTELLVELSRNWTRPGDISQEQVMSGSFDLLIVAWKTAMRHLLAAGAVTHETLRNNLAVFRSDMDIHFGRPRWSIPGTWPELLAQVAGGHVPSHLLKDIDRSLIARTPTDEESLKTLLAPTTPGGNLCLERMRLFRKAEDCLSVAAVDWLTSCLRSAVACRDPVVWTYEFCVATEVVATATLREELADCVVGFLQETGDVTRVIPLAYTLLGRGWRTW